jgi:hypothetical protein
LDLKLDELETVAAFIPVMDNDTRWSSVMTMLEKALAQRIRIDLYCSYVPELEKDRLTDADWDDLVEVTLQ